MSERFWFSINGHVVEAPAVDRWYAAHRRRVEAEYAAAQEAQRAAQVAEINRVLGRIDEMGIEH